MAVAPWIVSDLLWQRIEPLPPKVERRFRYPGRKRLGRQWGAELGARGGTGRGEAA
jgi:hypothetical protein